jgi:ATP-dependent Clp protease ATP-binding subunit ClpC
MHMSADAPSPSKLAMMSYFGKKTSRLDGYGQPRPHFLSTSTRTNNRREAMRLYAMFERFTDKAIRVLMAGQQEAQEMGYAEIGSEQLLLGLIAEDSGIAAQVLKQNGLRLNSARDKVRSVLGPGPGTNSTEIAFTPRCKRILERAHVESKNQKSGFVGTEHLLLALVNERDSPGIQIMEELGASPKKVVEDVMELLEKDGGEKPEMAGVGGRQDTATLEQFTSNLTKLAEEGQLDPVVGRAKQIERVIQILNRRSKNNPCLVGLPGVGKTAIAEGLAQRISDGDVPRDLQTKQVWSLDMGAIVAGTQYRGQFEERLKKVVDEATKNDNVILVIDEVHTLVGAGSAEGAMDASNLLKPALARGQLQIIGATTLDEYRKHIEKDAALERRFQPVTVPEPTIEEAAEILRGLRDRYEDHHNLHYTDESLWAAAKLSTQYINDRYLPDKAIDLMDEAGSRIGLRRPEFPASVQAIVDQLVALQMEKRDAVREQDYLRASEMQSQILSLQDSFNKQIAERKAEREELRRGSKIAESIKNDLPALKQELIEVTDRKEEAIKNEDYVKANEEYASEKQLQAQLEFLEEEDILHHSNPDIPLWEVGSIVTGQDIAEIVSSWTNIPVTNMTAEESRVLLALEDKLHERVIGQHDAIVAIARAIRRARVGLKSPNRPIASFFFSGPTGVGKSELAKALAATYFGSEESMVRFDMSEYMESHTVAKLIGSPPGYVGYDEGGQLTEAVRRKPYTVVLFDEIEKANPEVFNIMLQILEDGRLTDGKGRTINFKNTLLIMTSNVGSQVIAQYGNVAETPAGPQVQTSANMSKGSNQVYDAETGEPSLLSGGGSDDYITVDADGEAGADISDEYNRIKAAVNEELKRFFKPEFLNRLDDIVVFNQLTKSEVYEIAEIMLSNVVKQLAEKEIELQVTPEFKDLVVGSGYNPTYGARPLRRVMNSMLEDVLAECILQGKLEAKGTAVVSVQEGDVVVNDLDGNQLMNNKTAGVAPGIN